MTVTLSERPTDVEHLSLADVRSAIDDLVGDRFRVEILGGEVIVSPLARTLHMLIVMDVRRLLDDGCDRDRLAVTERLELFVDKDNRPQPDLAVIPVKAATRDLDATALPASDALLVVEVASPSNGDDDRKWGKKYKAYAKGLVPTYLLIDPHAEGGPEITVFEHPTGTRYNAETTVRFGEKLLLPEPFDTVEIDSSRFPVPASS
jgi:Uma2 family endonuclease